VYDISPSLVIGVVFAVATAVYTRYQQLYDNLMTASLLLLMSALVLTVIPPPGILVPLPEGYLVISLPIIFEAMGVTLLMIALTPIMGPRKTLSLATFIYVIAVVADTIIYYGEVNNETLLSSLLVNTIVYAPAVVAIIATAKKFKQI